MTFTAIAAPKPLTFSLLRALADGEFHSGQLLAQRFNVSRASVHNALQGIEQYGLTLYSVRGRGYRLVEPPQWLDAERIRGALRTPEVFHLNVFDSGASSNSALLQSAAQGAPGGTVLALEWQSAGRGRMGRIWHSGLGNALTFSLLWRFECGIAALSGLSLAVGIAMMRVLRELGVKEVGLKWPNDVVDGQGKLAGILIEAQGDMLGPSAVVIGIGLNLRLPEMVAQQIGQPVSDLARVMAVMPERNRLLALLLQALADVLAEFTQRGFVGLRDEWERYHLYQGRKVCMSLPDGSRPVGIVRGVTDDGALRVETQHGVQVFNAGEISLREA
jgi:BirA family biotin operon repressor/biotin-[acetyl-CoA-carboxylase] ligase